MYRNYAVYLPGDYYTSGSSYPVLYLLHGGGVDHRGWIQQGDLKRIADKAIAEGVAENMIIVLPDAFTQRRGYFQNKPDWAYEDFFFTEFMPAVENSWRIRKEQQLRAISGFSIGGKAAFTYALHHPELFGTACPISAAVNAANSEQRAAGMIDGNNVIVLIEQMPDSAKNKTRWYIDCGEDDFLYETNVQVHTAMMRAGIKTELRVRNGGHDWEYWRGSLPGVLEFISAGFREYALKQ
ncbi:MAG: alpha/beta hydrolase-fold protein [Chitinophagaceae bacterium]